jgi:acetyl esterase/lipase
VIAACDILQRTMRLRILALALALPSVVFAQDASHSTVDPDGTAHVTRVVPLPPSLSPEAKAWMSRPFPDADLKLPPATWRSMAEAMQARAATDGQALYPTTIKDDTIGGIAVKVVSPPSIPANKKTRVLICIHGGSFLADFGSVSEAMPIASLTQTKVVSVLYRLQPENAFPAAVDDVVAVYRELLKTYRPANIGIYGTSSGAALAAEVAVALKQKKIPPPAALGLLSVWGDFSQGGDTVNIYGVLGFSGAVGSNCSLCDVTPYIGKTDPRDPMLSPLYADLSGLPPTFFLTSTRDILLSGTTILHRAFLKAGVPAELVVFEGLSHAFWVTAPRTMPESIEANKMIASFLDRNVGRKK